MNRFFISPKFVVVATLATAALGAATVAEAARPEIFVSVDFQSRPSWGERSRGYYVQPDQVYGQPRPVYGQPQPVYRQPQPVYGQPRAVYVQPAPVYQRPPVFVSPGEAFEQPRFGRYDRRFEWERERAWRHAEWHRHERREDFRGWGRGRDDRYNHHGRPGGHWD